MNRTKKGTAKALIGNFGVPAGDERPHVLVVVPNSRKGVVQLFEVRQTVDTRLVRLPRAELTPKQWQAIVPTAEVIFNEHLREAGEQPGKFQKTGETRLSINNLGKEIILLAWAIEDATEDEVETIKASWQRLHRIERWWLYNQTVALNGDLRGRGKGWRAALRLALSATPTGPEVSQDQGDVTLRLQPARKVRGKAGKGGMEPMFRRESA